MRILFLLLLFISNTLIAQDKYWIVFKYKNTQGYSYENNLSKETIKNRTRFGLPLYQYTDIPVDNQYIIDLQSMGVKVLVKSKWLNSVSVFLTPEQAERISTLSYVQEVSKIDRRIQITGTLVDVKPEYYSTTIKQMGAETFLKEGLTGKGVSVGIIDAGFHQAVKDKFLTHIFSENKVILQRDFLDSRAHDLVRDSLKPEDNHGRQVLGWVCGYDSVGKIQMGLAPNSTFYLARTENDAREYRGEEDNWLMAMEWMDSLGVRLINTSLGYSINMDNPKDNYKQEEMDGKTTRIAKAAQIAVNEKGIFVVVSAGNEGNNNNWRIISSPADVEGVLSIGATTEKLWEKIGYSSIGPEPLSYLKPNVSCFSLYGTSFSAPAITGFVACLMERDSTINNKQLKDIVEKSGHIYPYGNNYIGYGIPQAGRAIKLIENRNYEFGNFIEKNVKGKKVVFKFDKALNMDVAVFHKKNKTIVIHQQKACIKNGRLLVKKLSGSARSTISLGLEVIEIIWE